MTLITRVGLFLYRIFRNKWFQSLFFLTAVILIIAYIWSNATILLETIKQIDLNIYPLVISGVIIGVTVFLGGISWSAILMGFGQEFPLTTNLKVFFRSSLVKYIPGFVWQYLSRGHLVRSIGVPLDIIPWILAWEFLQILWTGIFVILLTFSNRLIPNLTGFEDIGWIIRFATVIFLGAAPFLFFKLFFQKVEPTLRSKISVKWLSISTLIVFVGWIFLGAGLILLLEAFGFPNKYSLVDATFVYASSVISGILVIPVPNGIGIREGVMAVLLSNGIPIYSAVIIGSTIRVFISVFELLFGIISVATTKQKMD